LNAAFTGVIKNNNSNDKNNNLYLIIRRFDWFVWLGAWVTLVTWRSQYRRAAGGRRPGKRDFGL